MQGKQEGEASYIEAEAGKLLGKAYEGMSPLRIPQRSTEGVEELAKEHGVFIPKLHSIIHESDIDPDMAPATTMKNYEVFPEAEEIPWISDLLHMKPTRQILGVKFTEPIDLPDLPTGEFRWVRSAVSSVGCLYVLDNWSKVLHCVNLLTGQRSQVGPFEAESFVACHGDQVYVGTNGKDYMYVVDSGDLYEKLEGEPAEDGREGEAGPGATRGAEAAAAAGGEMLHITEYVVPMETLGTLACPRINQNYGFHACTELCPSTGVLTFLDESLSFIEYNVERREYNVYKNDKGLTRIISTTGVATSEYRMFATSTFLKRKMYGVTTIWSEKFIASLKWPIMLLVPSMREPDVVSRAAFVDSNGYIYYNGKSTLLTSPFRPADYQGLVRIHKDVFVLLDADTLVWRAMRIIVP